MDKKTKDAMKHLEAQGFKVVRQVEHRKHTFELPVDTLNEFLALADKKGLKVKEAIDQAVTSWIEKMRD